MTQKWHDLYMHGQRLEYVCKQMNKKYKKAIKENNHDMEMIYSEALRKHTMDLVSIAKIVLGVEEFVKNKKKLPSTTATVSYG